MPSRQVIRRIKLRRALLAGGTGRCFFCGFGFKASELGLPPTGEPGSYKARHAARPSLEHLVPLSQGGTDEPENCVLAHKWCNEQAGDRSLEEKLKFRDELRAKLGEPE